MLVLITVYDAHPSRRVNFEPWQQTGASWTASDCPVQLNSIVVQEDTFVSLRRTFRPAGGRPHAPGLSFGAACFLTVQFILVALN